MRDYADRHFVSLAFAEVGIDLKWRGSGIEEKGVDSRTGWNRMPGYMSPAIEA
jgi:GDPmannose 4,6-dehydratase